MPIIGSIPSKYQALLQETYPEKRYERVVGGAFLCLLHDHGKNCTFEVEYFSLQLKENPIGPVGVAVFGMRDDKCLLVKQERYTEGGEVINCIRGALDPEDESIEKAAQREMEEEAGEIGEEVIDLGLVTVDSETSANRIPLVLMKTRKSDGNGDAEEGTKPVLMKAQEVIGKVASGEIKDIFVTAVLLRHFFEEVGTNYPSWTEEPKALKKGPEWSIKGIKKAFPNMGINKDLVQAKTGQEQFVRHRLKYDKVDPNWCEAGIKGDKIGLWLAHIPRKYGIYRVLLEGERFLPPNPYYPSVAKIALISRRKIAIQTSSSTPFKGEKHAIPFSVERQEHETIEAAILRSVGQGELLPLPPFNPNNSSRLPMASCFLKINKFPPYHTLKMNGEEFIERCQKGAGPDGTLYTNASLLHFALQGHMRGYFSPPKKM